MDTTPQHNAEPVPSTNAFEQAGKESSGGLLTDFWQFLKHNKKWWLMPIVVMLLLLGVLFFFSGTAATPFIYAFF